jgi:hypothetical protein
VVKKGEAEEYNARSQAVQIERFWRDQGYAVSAWAERIEGHLKGRQGGYASFWAVRSDLVNGHPTRKLES